jgi:hypothetical protein
MSILVPEQYFFQKRTTAVVYGVLFRNSDLTVVGLTSLKINEISQMLLLLESA